MYARGWIYLLMSQLCSLETIPRLSTLLQNLAGAFLLNPPLTLREHRLSSTVLTISQVKLILMQSIIFKFGFHLS